jgi:hypothetical protein
MLASRPWKADSLGYESLRRREGRAVRAKTWGGGNITVVSVHSRGKTHLRGLLRGECCAGPRGELLKRSKPI